ncbi:MAG TPA: fused response regulator/phosphatase [Bacillota bacterium]|nr:fused response regulator/phosphatase [Bacillota bacterium]
MKSKVLVVDDSPINRKIIASSLTAKLSGIEIVEAADGYEALNILGEAEISVVLQDIMMPGMDGIATLEAIKARPELKNIPVIMVTALSEIELVEKALSLGALDYLTKPLTAEQIKITLPLKVKNALEFYEQKKQLLLFHQHMTDEMQLAESLQKSMIVEQGEWNGIKLWGRYIPCEDIGGDFFHCLPVGHRVWLIIADVWGHGIAAAMISTMLTVMFNAAVQQLETPGAVLESMNRMLLNVFQNSRYSVVSAFVACVDREKVHYANAGHPYPVIYHRKEQHLYQLESPGLLLGVSEQAEYPTLEMGFGLGDRLLMYTDGIFDKGGPEGFAGWPLVYEYCRDHAGDFDEDLPGALDRMIDYFTKRQGHGFIDDAAVMLICRNA